MMEHWMYGYGAGHWLWFVVVAAVVLYPTGRILGRMGFSPFWSILAFIPLLNLIGLWIIAFAEWPEKPTWPLSGDCDTALWLAERILVPASYKWRLAEAIPEDTRQLADMSARAAVWRTSCDCCSDVMRFSPSPAAAAFPIYKQNSWVHQKVGANPRNWNLQ